MFSEVDTFDSYTSSLEEMDPIFEENLARALDSWPRAPEVGGTHSVDLNSTAEQLVVQIYLPGLDLENVKVDVNEYSLKLYGALVEMVNSSWEDIYSNEPCRGTLQIEVPLPEKVKVGKYSTSYTSGIFRVMLTKT